MSVPIKTDGGRSPVPTLPRYDDLESAATSVDAIVHSMVMPGSGTPALLERFDAVGAVLKRAWIPDATRPASKMEAGNYIAMLIKSNANAKPLDAAVYSGTMLQDVMAMKPTVAAIEIACRRWRTKSRWLPEISDILTEIKFVQGMLTSAQAFLDTFDATRARIQREISDG